MYCFLSQCSSPRRLNASPQATTVQDTDDRIPKESIYGTVRYSPRRLNASPQATTVQDTDDRIPKESIYGTVR